MRQLTKLLCVIMTLALLLTTGGFSYPVTAQQPQDSKGDKLNNAIVLYVGSPLALVNTKELQLDEANTEVTPVIKDDRTLVPVRFISESIGAKVEWDAKTSTASIVLGKKKVNLTLGSTTMVVNNAEVKLETTAESINNRIFIPLRAMTEALGKKVFYDRGLIVISDKDNIFDTSTEKTALDTLISKLNKPPVVGTSEALKKLLLQASGINAEDLSRYDMDFSTNKVMKEKSFADSKSNEVQSAPAMAAKAESKADRADYSTTNVQVGGVDEADIIKTDGEYIYQVNNQRIIIAKAYPAEEMSITSTLNFEYDKFAPQEMYVDNKYLVAIGTANTAIPMYKSGTSDSINKIPDYPINTVKAIIFDITDKSNIKKLREVELEGSYVSSRKIGSKLYIISNKNINMLFGYNELSRMYFTGKTDSQTVNGISIEDINKSLELAEKPSYRDTAGGSDFVNIGYPDIRYFPGCLEPNYIVIAGIDLEKLDAKANISAYLGAGQNIYASEQNLYISASNYSDYRIMKSKIGIMPSRYRPSTNTVVYKFSLNEGTVTYLSKGEVPGTILNQFSMDENGKHFRIATTQWGQWREGGESLRNNLYVLDDMLNITGKIEDIAPGEKIYSVRFMGDKGYIVTFKTVDPLFAIDLKDAKNPRILGALKIPGYSDYIHPYDENHIIGFGKDTVELSGGAYYLGMKMAIFDVSDMTNPKEMFTAKLGDRGTDSELLRNHKALLFSKSKNLLAFPVTLTEVKNKEQVKSEYPLYGEFTFQGAYVYNIDLEKGFSVKGRITHISQDEYLKSGNSWYGSDKNVERIIYIGDTLYTLSKGMIKANSLNDMKEKKVLPIQ